LNAYWVYENIKQDVSAFNKLDTFLLLASVVLWKRKNPYTKNILVCDRLTRAFLRSYKCTKLWDEVKLVNTKPEINKKIFWASSKLLAMQEIEEPFVLMDHDFLVYQSFEGILKDRPVFTVEEDGIRYYPSAYDNYIKLVSDILPRPKQEAINCSFMYFPDTSFSKLYADTAVQLMERFSELNVPNSKYLIFAEQLSLKFLLDREGIKFNTLLKAKWHSKDKKYYPIENGIFSLEESNLHFRHYWMEKPELRGKPDNEELTILTNILKNTGIKFFELNQHFDIGREEVQAYWHLDDIK